jgi:WD40 repeat protein
VELNDAFVIFASTVPNDPHPQWQRLSWSPDGTRLAVATSAGDIFIFDGMGGLLHSIDGRRFEMDDGIAGLAWRSKLRYLELIVLTYDGQLRRYVISNSARVPPIPLSQFVRPFFCRNLRISYSCRLTRFIKQLELDDDISDQTVIDMSQYHRFATALAYHGPTDTLVIGGSIINASEQSQERSVTFWKLLEEAPFISSVSGCLESQKPGRGLLKGLSAAKPNSAIFQVRVRTPSVLMLFFHDNKVLIEVLC